MITEELQDEIQRHKKSLELSEMVKQLESNKAFDTVIGTDLFKTRVSALVSQLALVNTDSSDYSNIIRELDSISYLGSYLNSLKQAGETAEDMLREARNALDNFEES